MKISLYLTIISSLILSACSTVVTISDEESKRMQLDGTWTSSCVNEGATNSSEAEFSFPFEVEKSRIIIVTKIFTGNGCLTENKLFKYEQQGYMSIETDAKDELTVFDSVYEGDSIKANMFVNVLNKITVTPYTDDALIMLGALYPVCDVSFTKQIATDVSKCEQPDWGVDVDQQVYAAFYMISENQILTGAMYQTKADAINDFNENPLFPFTKQ